MGSPTVRSFADLISTIDDDMPTDYCVSTVIMTFFNTGITALLSISSFKACIHIPLAMFGLRLCLFLLYLCRPWPYETNFHFNGPILSIKPSVKMGRWTTFHAKLSDCQTRYGLWDIPPARQEILPVKLVSSLVIVLNLSAFGILMPHLHYGVTHDSDWDSYQLSGSEAS